MSRIVPEVLDRVTASIAEIDPAHLDDREVIAYLAGISETAAGMLAIRPDLQAHADLVMDLANRAFHANEAAEARGRAKGYRQAIADLRTDEAIRVMDTEHAESCAGAPWHQCTDPHPDEVYLTAMANHLEQLAGAHAMTPATPAAPCGETGETL